MSSKSLGVFCRESICSSVESDARGEFTDSLSLVDMAGGVKLLCALAK